MKIRFLVLAGLISVMSSVTCAQNLYIISSSTPAFGQARTYAWSQQANPSPIADSSLAEQVRSQINKQLDNVGLWPGQQSADLIVVASETVSDQSSGTGTVGAEFGSARPEETPNNLTIEIHDASTNQLVWEGVAIHVLRKGESQQNNQSVESAIGQLFKSFPYRVNEWDYATP